MPVSAALFPHIYPAGEQKSQICHFISIIFYFYKSVGKFAMTVIENQMANFPTLL